MKRVLFIITACLLLLLLAAPDWIAPEPFYVHDELGLLSRSVKMEIATSAAALNEQSGARIVVLSGNSLLEQSDMEGAGLIIGGADMTGVVVTLLGSETVVISLDVARNTAWVSATDDLTRALVDKQGDSYIGLYELESFSRDALLLYRDVLSCVMKQYGISSLPRHGALEKYIALSRAELVWTLALVIALVMFIGWLKRRRYPPHYQLEKAGPHRPAEAPDLLTHTPH